MIWLKDYLSRHRKSTLWKPGKFSPDASLGCPQPGTTYDQVEVPGYLILLQANGNEFEYHANIHNYVFYCENPTPPILETPASGPPHPP
jgi:hypothetical protein